MPLHSLCTSTCKSALTMCQASNPTPDSHQTLVTLPESNRESNFSVLQLLAIAHEAKSISQHLRMEKAPVKKKAYKSHVTGSSRVAFTRSLMRGYDAFSSSWFCAHINILRRLGSFGSAHSATKRQVYICRLFAHVQKERKYWAYWKKKNSR